MMRLVVCSEGVADFVSDLVRAAGEVALVPGPGCVSFSISVMPGPQPGSSSQKLCKFVQVLVDLCFGMK